MCYKNMHARRPLTGSIWWTTPLLRTSWEIFLLQNIMTLLNDVIVSTLHMINVFENSNPLIGSLQRPQECNRIATFGIADLESGEENLFYSLDLTRERCYYYAINKKRLEEDGTLIKKIKSQVKSKIQENLRVSYGVFPTEYEQDYVFCKAYTSQIQLKKE